MTTETTTKHPARPNEKPAKPRSRAARGDVAAPLLSDAQVAALRPRLETKGKHAGKLRPVKTFLGRGLFVLTTPTGVHSLRYPTTGADGKPTTITLGVHGPDLSVMQAWEKVDAMRKKLALPVSRAVVLDELRSEQRKARGDGRTFKQEAEDWLALMKAHWTPRYHKQVTALLVNDAIETKGNPNALGPWPLTAITAPLVLKCVQRVEQRGALDVAADLCQKINTILDLAKNNGSGGLKDNVASAVHKSLKKRTRTHFDAITAEDLPRLFADIRERVAAGQMKRLTELGLRLMLHTCVRTDTLRHTHWDWVDIEAREIRYPHGTPGLLKAGDLPGDPDYIVPLSEQALDVLAEIEKEGRGEGLLFPNRTKPWKPYSNGTWLVALGRMGWTGEREKDDPEFRPNVTVHGFRSTFRQLAGHEWANKRQQEYAVEVQMDHRIADETIEQLGVYLRVNGTYRELFLDERRALMDWWSAYLVKCEHMKPQVAERAKRNAAKGGRAAQAALRQRRERQVIQSETQV